MKNYSRRSLPRTTYHVPRTSAQMRKLDQRAVHRYGIPVLLLMDHAGRAVAETVRGLTRGAMGRVVTLAGGGNNGGDGVAAARWLKSWGFQSEVWWLQDPRRWTGDLGLHYRMARALRVEFHSFLKRPATMRIPDLRRSDVLIDALVGTGMKGPLRVLVFDAITCANASCRPIVAVDLPSGLDADTGEVREIAIHARVTVTMGAAKTGLLARGAKAYVGRLQVADIGLPLVS